MWLDIKGYKYEYLKAKTQERKKPSLSLMLPHTKGSVEALAKATTHGDKFLVTGGRHYTDNDALKSAEIEANNRDVKMMEEDKTKRLGQENIEKGVLAIIELETPIDDIINTHFKMLLLCYGVTKNEMGTKTKMKQKYKGNGETVLCVERSIRLFFKNS